MGLLTPRWQQRVAELLATVETLHGRVDQATATIAGLQQQVAALSGRLSAAENLAHAANNRSERLETRLAGLEHHLPRPVVGERPFPATDEDAVPPAPPAGFEVCTKCDGKGILGGMKRCDLDGVQTIGSRVCDQCAGKGMRLKLVLPADVPLPTRRKICPTCRGAGHYFKMSEGRSGGCDSCSGRGWVDTPA